MSELRCLLKLVYAECGAGEWHQLALLSPEMGLPACCSQGSTLRRAISPHVSHSSNRHFQAICLQFAYLHLAGQWTLSFIPMKPDDFNFLWLKLLIYVLDKEKVHWLLKFQALGTCYDKGINCSSSGGSCHAGRDTCLTMKGSHTRAQKHEIWRK